ncbi:hypothetical protein P168DRAFT_34891 [Aspergillus campestris IBT 28561]|uniref:Uncharacterized protein n=1 Tax=Aspergillus campestris (strain IBT 28561) TaxID=1392248 RepID=A0A2I1DHH9_ASPC2|nr:uncharacterized protein P168DRAFT_34891 [Aspergillus campestris IBT 28561]PKY09334.1 hypothetical protein P168DRAFT_34891 [Aspergillus campestris IBT 28561]
MMDQVAQIGMKTTQMHTGMAQCDFFLIQHGVELNDMTSNAVHPQGVRGGEACSSLGRIRNLVGDSTRDRLSDTRGPTEKLKAERPNDSHEAEDGEDDWRAREQRDVTVCLVCLMTQTAIAQLIWTKLQSTEDEVRTTDNKTGLIPVATVSQLQNGVISPGYN